MPALPRFSLPSCRCPCWSQPNAFWLLVGFLPHLASWWTCAMYLPTEYGTIASGPVVALVKTEATPSFCCTTVAQVGNEEMPRALSQNLVTPVVDAGSTTSIGALAPPTWLQFVSVQLKILASCAGVRFDGASVV